MKLNIEEVSHARTIQETDRTVLENNARQIEEINNAIKEIEGFEGVEPKPCLRTPKESWDNKNSGDMGNPGEYTVDPKALEKSLDDIFLKEAFSVDCNEMLGKSIKEVAQYIIEKYGDTHYIPGVEYWEYVTKMNSSNEISETWKDGYTHHFLGSTIRDKNGSLNVFDAVWYSTSWGSLIMNASGLWNKHSRVTLIKK